MRDLNEILMLIAAAVAVIGMAVVVIPIGLEREDRRICIQAAGWVRNNGADLSEIPDYCYARGFLERK